MPMHMPSALARFHRIALLVVPVLAGGLAGCVGGGRADDSSLLPADDSDAGASMVAADDPLSKKRDGGLKHGTDLAMPQQGAPDLAMPNQKGGVGPAGGTVHLLHFGVTGDTRPGACEDTAHYPTTIINSIADAWLAQGAQFGVDLGDHMYVCNNQLPIATAQMDLYMSAVARFGGTWFMTMGNHECWKGPCLPGSTNANYVAYMNALAPIAKLPYYSIDIHTSLGLATFVFVADNAFDNAQATWLEETLAAADKNATYTLVARHHPEGDSTVVTNQQSMAIIRKHKFSVLLTGHNHDYKHMTTDQGRDVVIGVGGAPLLSQGTFYGYMMVDQQNDGSLLMTVYDVNGNHQMDSWKAGPN